MNCMFALEKLFNIFKILSVICLYSMVLDAQSGQEEEGGDIYSQKYNPRNLLHCSAFLFFPKSIKSRGFFELKIAELFPRP